MGIPAAALGWGEGYRPAVTALPAIPSRGREPPHRSSTPAAWRLSGTVRMKRDVGQRGAGGSGRSLNAGRPQAERERPTGFREPAEGSASPPPASPGRPAWDPCSGVIIVVVIVAAGGNADTKRAPLPAFVQRARLGGGARRGVGTQRRGGSTLPGPAPPVTYPHSSLKSPGGCSCSHRSSGVSDSARSYCHSSRLAPPVARPSLLPLFSSFFFFSNPPPTQPSRIFVFPALLEKRLVSSCPRAAATREAPRGTASPAEVR